MEGCTGSPSTPWAVGGSTLPPGLPVQPGGREEESLFPCGSWGTWFSRTGLLQLNMPRGSKVKEIWLGCIRLATSQDPTPLCVSSGQAPTEQRPPGQPKATLHSFLFVDRGTKLCGQASFQVRKTTPRGVQVPPRGSQAGGPGMGFGPTRLKFLGKNIFGGKIHLDGPILGGSQGGPAPGWVGGPGS